MSDDLVSKRRAERCTTHSHACDCREYAHAQEIERLRASLESSREVNAKLFQRRDEMDAEIAGLRTRIADAPTAEVTLGCYLDADQLPPEFALRRVALVVVDE